MSEVPVAPQTAPWPQRNEAPANYTSMADAVGATLPATIAGVNEVAAFINQRAIVAAASATTASQHEQVAADQAALANTARQGAEAAATAAEMSAAIAGAATGIDTKGKEGLPLVVDASGMVVASSGYKRYDVASLVTTTVLDMAEAQVFKIDVTSNRTLTFSNPPAANRAMTAVVVLTGSLGSYSVEWPAEILWDTGSPPSLGGSVLVVVLQWVGGVVIGSRGAAA